MALQTPVSGATPMLVAGGGIGGLAAALALGRAGHTVTLLEQAAQFSEVGAGVQSGPNVVRQLQAWGLGDALARVAAFPQRIHVRSASSGAELAALPLADFAQRYGAPYVTLHRADLHGLLLQAVQAAGHAELRLGVTVTSVTPAAEQVVVALADGATVTTPVLVGADGIWSVVRRAVLDDGAPHFTGHLAYRALVAQDSLPAALRSQQVTVWLGPGLHVVQYPVRAGAALNVVAVIEGGQPPQPNSWDQQADADNLFQAMAGSCAPLQDLLRALAPWRCWALSVRSPLQASQQMARDRVALLGDAAHPMLPYLAQGAGMAIEDAGALQRVLGAGAAADVPTALQAYAQQRWQRNAQVQARSLRNGRIFHASGPLRWGRDAAMRVMGSRLLDLKWLYGQA